jgi:uncharacterized transporter YbjL
MHKKQKSAATFDGVYVLKLVLYVILGSLWVKLRANGSNFNIPLPLGLVIGLLFTSHEHFRIDRKIEYAVLVVATLLGLIAPYGLFINL